MLSPAAKTTATNSFGATCPPPCEPHSAKVSATSLPPTVQIPATKTKKSEPTRL